METLLCSVAALSQLSSVTVHVCLDRGGRLDVGRGGGGGGVVVLGMVVVWWWVESFSEVFIG